ncbi:unnamed protein product [Dracunculus medinensis]|uniref:Uncharacterized protein n=1 Tax=Dracunculus medinensis TaxID=318479 RepID=A0A0N4UNL6_DRAME|nr:unnamed protein product [Dracunculus medinensis]
MGTNVTKELLNNSISNSSGDDPDFNLSSSDPQRESNANNLTIGPSVDRNPRCMDLILDCGMKVGQVTTCYTWISGMISMQRECLNANGFKVVLAKTKEKITKLQVELREICSERRKQGLRC